MSNFCHSWIGIIYQLLHSKISTLLISTISYPQCRGGTDRGLHQPLHRAGEDAVRGGGGRLPDGEDPEDPEAGHGADQGPVSVLLPGGPGVPLLLRPLHGQLTVSRPRARGLKKFCHPPHLW